MSHNPFEAPKLQSQAVLTKAPPPSFRFAFMRWLPICAISAIPSLWMGIDITDGPGRIAAMLAGIVMFALFYAAFEVLWLGRAMRDWWTLRRALYIGFGIRMAISIIVPVGMFVDMPIGLASVAIGCAIFPAMNQGLPFSGFPPILFTTLLQGFFLNCILAAFLAVVYTALRLLGMPPRPQTPQRLSGG